jgi:hypothetical protein
MFKVGDKVRVIGFLDEYESFLVEIGEVGEVSKVYSEGDAEYEGYPYEVMFDPFTHESFKDGELELVKED